MTTETLTPPALKTEKSYLRYVRIRMSSEQAEKWDSLTKEEIDEISEPFQAPALDRFNDLVEKKAESLKAQQEFMAQIPPVLLDKAQKLGMTLSLTPA